MPDDILAILVRKSFFNDPRIKNVTLEIEHTTLDPHKKYIHFGGVVKVWDLSGEDYIGRCDFIGDLIIDDSTDFGPDIIFSDIKQEVTWRKEDHPQIEFFAFSVEGHPYIARYI